MIRSKLLILSCLLCFLPLRLESRENKPSPRNASKLTGSALSFVVREIQGFNLRVWLSNQMAAGLSAWDASAGSQIPLEPHVGLDYPAGSNVEHLFGGGPMLAGIANGVRRVDEGFNLSNGGEFLPEVRHFRRAHFWRTAVGNPPFDDYGWSGFYYNHNASTNRAGVDDDGDLRVDEDPLDGLDNDGDWNPVTDDVGEDGLPDSLEASCDGTPYDSLSNPDPAQDNYEPASTDKCHPNAAGMYPLKSDKDFYTERNGVPDHGEPHVDEDFGSISDRDLSCTASDIFSSPFIPGHVPMGVELIQKSFAWKYPSADALTFLEYDYVDTGRYVIRDAYGAYFADMDVGPVDITRYYQHNYAAYDSATRTAYISNPIDTGSTPLGITVLDLGRPIDSLKFIFRWLDYGSDPPVVGDTGLYSLLSGAAFPMELIRPNQDSLRLSDTRLFVSAGPYPVISPGDTLRQVYAYVAGRTIHDMLNNARRAHRIYERRGFIMPDAHLRDPGGSGPLVVSWPPLERSPWGNVASYIVYRGDSSRRYTDSVTTMSTSVSFPSSSGRYFAVRAVDTRGNRSALSDETTVFPDAPPALSATGRQVDILIRWTMSTDGYVSGYNVYRRTSDDSLFRKLNPAPISDSSFVDTAVWGNRVYSYKISALGRQGYESVPSVEVKGRLKPPAAPSGFVIGPGNSLLHLAWTPNPEGDLKGYNVYRSDSSTTVKLNSSIWKNSDYVDSVGGGSRSYTFIFEAV